MIGFFYQILTGTDKVDIDERPRAEDLLKSKLFLVGTIANVHQALYLVVLSASLYVFCDLPDLELVTIWSAVMFALSVPFALYYALLVRKRVSFRVPYKAILKYLVGGAGMATTFVLANEHIVEFEISIYSYLPGLLLEVVLCCAVYLGITYAIDHKTRKLFRVIML